MFFLNPPQCLRDYEKHLLKSHFFIYTLHLKTQSLQLDFVDAVLPVVQVSKMLICNTVILEVDQHVMSQLIIQRVIFFVTFISEVIISQNLLIDICK